MDTPASHEDATTTDYDSGDSEGVSYAYEGGKGLVCLKQPADNPPSPRRKLTSGSPKGKPRSPARCVCEASRKQPQTLSLSRSRSPSPLDDAESLQLEEDTDIEGGVEDHARSTRRRLSGPDNKVQRTDSSKSSKRKTVRKRSPYIEEYPDEKGRPVILLKEHKLPRRASGSDAKPCAQASEDVQCVTSASRGRSPPRTRLPAWSTFPEAQSPKHAHPAAPPRRNRSELHCAPGGTFSDLDQVNSDPRSQHKKPAKPLDSSPPRRRRSHGTQRASEMTPSPKQTPAWPAQLQYSSSWPLQNGPSHPVQDHEYESDDESDCPPETRPHLICADAEMGYGERPHGKQIGGHTATAMDAIRRGEDPHRAVSHRRSHGDSGRDVRPSDLPTPHRNRTSPEKVPSTARQAQRHRPSHAQDSPHHQQTNHVRPPRPIIARTIVSQRSMAAMDQGYPRASTATSLCEIWRGRPEDWESPYSSSDDENDFMPNLDGEPVPFLKQLALEESPAGYHGSNASCFSGRPRSRSRHPHQQDAEFPHHGALGVVGFLRRFDAAAGFDGFDGLVRCESPDLTDDNDVGEPGERIFLDVITTRGGRAASRARSRWTVMAPRERELDDPPVRRWTFDGPTNDSRCGASVKRPRSPSPVFSARKTREFLSPRPRRPERFDYDAWGRERASRSMLALGLNPVLVR
ncbi:hypothetical protein B0T18DRAFT_20673 [Schizothecium vesticola]|uniref:Uncharacterized protein n=1 Tax=Schizothecium vesticola TaxID=314040 RepID=A0AA40KCE1_9PEZI|nr:hypothetical protein B0T18DRAFT_20673 [Schizothecium vesticola]